MVASFYIMLYLRNIPFSIPCDKMGDIRGRGRGQGGKGEGRRGRKKKEKKRAENADSFGEGLS